MEPVEIREEEGWGTVEERSAHARKRSGAERGIKLGIRLAELSQIELIFSLKCISDDVTADMGP